MKKVMCLITVLLLCISLAAPAFAAEGGFVPSIDYKDEPEIVPPTDPDDPNRDDYVGVVRDEDGEPMDYVEEGCLRITSIAEAMDEEEDVPQVIRDLLTDIFGALNNGDMQIPFEKFDEGYNQSNMTVRDLFDARWTCEEHPKMLEPEGVVFEITFDLGVDADEEIFVMTYDEETEVWEPIVKTVNNGDGTVTCTFEHLCAISFSVATGQLSQRSGGNLWLWLVLILVAAAAVVGLLVAKKGKKSGAAA